ncbi:MAG: ornithine cyclodeaminase family protein [Candidatus Aminicenantes bacterium]|nr:MAG: ornithine cyclodeaminase family protein [Candidatus Aminicenantes bacterium]
MADIFNLDQIKEALKNIDSIKAIEDGFVAYSQGKAIVPPVGEMLFKYPPGDVHIKYGYIIGDDYYVIKIASGFYENIKLGLPTGSGLMLVFKQKTGELACILLDEAHLTNVRTAAAGAVAALYLAPRDVHCIGIFGAGTQGRMQLEYLKSIVDCKEVMIWGINQQEVDAYKKDMEPLGYNIQIAQESNDIAKSCNLIVTATPSTSPLLQADQIQKGTHITALGSDTPEKNELDPKILGIADILVADSISQCELRGEIFHALKAGSIEKEKIVELGNVIEEKELQRSSEEQITVADLTGVAVQDIQISKAVYEALAPNEK